MLSTILLILVILIVIGGIPNLGVHQYGWGPSGFGLVLLIILLVMLFGGRL